MLTQTTNSGPDSMLIPGTPSLVPGVVINDTYRIVRVLGEGGMGRVYEVEHIGLSSRAALKIISTRLQDQTVFIERFRREAKLLGQLKHNNIVTVFDYNQFGKRPYVVMELLEGVDLAVTLRRDGPPPLRTALEWIKQIGEGLSAAHQKGIIHRDLKPHNLFLCRSSPNEPSRVVILDFGIARSITSQPGSFATDAEAAAFLGTAAYASPEQARGDVDLDARCDEFALGSIVYELLSGRKAFAREGDDKAESLRRVQSEDPPPLPWPLLNAVVSRALSKARQARYPSVSEFVDAVVKAGERDVQALHAPRRWPWAAALLVLIGSVSVHFSYSARWRSAQGTAPPVAVMPLMSLQKLPAEPVVLTAMPATPPPPVEPIALVPVSARRPSAAARAAGSIQVRTESQEAKKRIEQCAHALPPSCREQLPTTTVYLEGRFEDGLRITKVEEPRPPREFLRSLLECLHQASIQRPLVQRDPLNREIKVELRLAARPR